jgi:hypothetical protein
MQDVFEPTANFGGEVFEPMNYDGDYSNFGLRSKKTPEQIELDKKNAEAKAKLKADAKANKQPRDLGKLKDSLLDIVKTGTDTISQLAPIMQKTEFQKNLEARCGKKGTFLGLGKPRQSYLDCAESFMKAQGVTNAQFDQWKESLDSDSGDKGGQSNPSGMSLGAKIGITAGILAVVGVAVFFIVKKK